jgi:hypothetical protein
MKYDRFCFCVLLIVILTAGPLLFATSSPRALILSGQNNHDWRKTTPTLKQILADSGVSAEITEKPENITAQMLSDYDVIVSNYNTFGTENDENSIWTLLASCVHTDLCFRYIP